MFLIQPSTTSNPPKEASGVPPIFPASINEMRAETLPHAICLARDHVRNPPELGQNLRWIHRCRVVKADNPDDVLFLAWQDPYFGYQEWICHTEPLASNRSQQAAFL